ncbi:hypothetical protein [Fuerstiella marisgermanici]|uniref:hypothetical protein n=1 Tax=Fuerstiella marisgermanici TaxID=1891926 RepID=UPI00097C7241|nr:hypothetical protein [Fuerstiella marisgermanici]
MSQKTDSDAGLGQTVDNISRALDKLNANLQSGNRKQEANFRSLADAICVLSEQVEVLRNAVDDLREEFQWKHHNEPASEASRSFASAANGSSASKSKAPPPSASAPPPPHGRLF